MSVTASYDLVSGICQTLGRGVTRSKRKAAQWLRKAAENGITDACLKLAQNVYLGLPYAREVGLVEEAAGADGSAGVAEGFDVPPDVLTSVVHWLWLGGHNKTDKLDVFRRMALVGAAYCRNNGCEVGGKPKDFKVCPQCKTARYCRRRVSETGLDCGWAQGHVWHSRIKYPVPLFSKIGLNQT